jgi:hypothetical protein
LGRQGWELVQVVDGKDVMHSTVFYFKRPVEETYR